MIKQNNFCIIRYRLQTIMQNHLDITVLFHPHLSKKDGKLSLAFYILTNCGSMSKTMYILKLKSHKNQIQKYIIMKWTIFFMLFICFSLELRINFVQFFLQWITSVFASSLETSPSYRELFENFFADDFS